MGFKKKISGILHYLQVIAIYLSSRGDSRYQPERQNGTCFDRFNFWYL